MKKSADSLDAMAVTWRQGAISRSDCVNGFNDVARKLKTLYATFERGGKYVDGMYKKYKKRTANKKHKKRTANKKHNK